jgi:hypothetical protein
VLIYLDYYLIIGALIVEACYLLARVDKGMRRAIDDITPLIYVLLVLLWFVLILRIIHMATKRRQGR